MGKETIYLPDFIIVGANKAGTTSVANYLNDNPEIKISDVKEPMFFSSTADTESSLKKDADLANPYMAIRLKHYSKMFENHSRSTKVFGEASTAYLAAPKISASLMKKIVPDIKLVAILREPVSRAISAYKMCLGNGIEDRSFSEVVNDAGNQLTILDQGHGVKEYVRNGLYSQLLAPYFKYFDKSQILVLNYDDLKENPEEFMHNISLFLNIKYHKVNFDQKYNMESEHLKEEVIINEDDKIKLKKYFMDDMLKLQEIVDFDINSWIK